MKRLLRFLKNWTLPVAIAVGCTLYVCYWLLPHSESLSYVVDSVANTIFPLFIFLTLLITFCKVDFHELRPHRWHLWISIIQLLLVSLCVAVVLLVGGDPHQRMTAEAVLTCVIAPCASAAPVVTGKLGGNLNTMTTFVLLSNVTSSLLIPAVFPILEPSAGVSFGQAFIVILQRVAVVLLLPLVLGYIVQHRVEALRRWVAARRDLAFYTWAISLTMTAGITMRNLLRSGVPASLLLAIALLSLAICWLQFGIGRLVGRHCGETVNTGQAMFQKNTGMAIWVAYMFLSPVASVGAGCYVLWQNIINSMELRIAAKHDKKADKA